MWKNVAGRPINDIPGSEKNDLAWYINCLEELVLKLYYEPGDRQLEVPWDNFFRLCVFPNITGKEMSRDL